MIRFWMVLDDVVNLVLKVLKELKGGEIFVFKNFFFLIMEFVKVLNLNGIIKEVGIREGEKIYEVMIIRDDVKYIYDYEDYYVIYFNFEWWNKEKIKSGGKLILENWDYNLGINDWWLDVKELEKRIVKLDIKY